MVKLYWQQFLLQVSCESLDSCLILKIKLLQPLQASWMCLPGEQRSLTHTTDDFQVWDLTRPFQAISENIPINRSKWYCHLVMWLESHFAVTWKTQTVSSSSFSTLSFDHSWQSWPISHPLPLNNKQTSPHHGAATTMLHCLNGLLFCQ